MTPSLNFKHQTVGSALDLFQTLSEWRLSTQAIRRPNLLAQMSAQKTVAFIKTWKNLVDREETGYHRRQRRHLLTLYQVQCWGIWGTEGPGILSVSVSCAFAVSNSNNKSPIETASPFFLSEQAHKASCTRLQLSSTERTTSSRLFMHLFYAQVVLAVKGSKNTFLGIFTYFHESLLPWTWLFLFSHIVPRCPKFHHKTS